MKFRAPRGNREVLAEPGFEALPGLVEANRRLLDRSDVMVGDISLRELRSLARREVIAAARTYLEEHSQSPGTAVPGLSASTPLVLAGHQPELSHPGVWVKHFALNGLARRVGGIPLNLVVDNDTMKSASLRVPGWQSTLLDVDSNPVPFDHFKSESPYEYRSVNDWSCFETFADRVTHLIREWPYEPILKKAWKRIFEYPAIPIGEKFAGVRRGYEQAWGCHNLELPVSLLAKSKAFAHFSSDILENLAHFRDVYNRALHEYRDRHGIRSTAHPVPDLTEQEIPFWSEPGPDGKRSRGFSSSRNLRPRALTLTLFARVCLGDFFIHGIGGGTYDEVTDAIIRDYYGLEPPAFQVLSATLHLPLPTLPSTPEELQQATRGNRDVDWNPQRYLTPEQRESEEIRKLLKWKEGLCTNEPPYQDHAARKWRFQNLQEVTRQLRTHVADARQNAAARLKSVTDEVHANAILQRRDYAWVLYPEEMLREFCTSVGERGA